MASDFFLQRLDGRSPSHASLLPESSDSASRHEAITANQQVLLSSILRELQDANSLNQKLAALPPNKYDFLWTILLQTFAVITGIVFGVFAILAWIASSHSNRLASESLNAAKSANSLASRANEMGQAANSFARLANIMAANANSVATEAYSAQSTAQVTANAQAQAANKMALVAYCAGVSPSRTEIHKICESVRSAAMATFAKDVNSFFPELATTAPVSHTFSGPTRSFTSAPQSSSDVFLTTNNQPSTAVIVTTTHATTSTSSEQASSAPNATQASSARGTHQGLSTSAKAGLGIGAATALVGLLFGLWYPLWRSYQYKVRKAKDSQDHGSAARMCVSNILAMEAKGRCKAERGYGESTTFDR